MTEDVSLKPTADEDTVTPTTRVVEFASQFQWVLMTDEDAFDNIRMAIVHVYIYRDR